MRSSPVRRFVSTALVVLATVLAFGSVYAVWARRQALDGPTWAHTSTQILRDGQVRLALATYLADQLVADPSARVTIAPQLLTEAQQSAGDAEAQLHAAIVREAQIAFTAPAAEAAWRTATERGRVELLALLDGTAAPQDDGVVLDLRDLVRTLAVQIRMDPSLVDQLPDDTVRLRVMRAGDVPTGQDALRAVRGLSVVLPVLTVLLWTLALLVARGRRRATAGQIGVGLVLVGVAVLLTRSLAKSALLDALVLNSSDRAAAGQVWSITTTLLRDGAIAVAVVGALLAVGAVLLRRGDPDGTDILDELANLDRLRRSGRIDAAEYERRRRRVLSAG